MVEVSKAADDGGSRACADPAYSDQNKCCSLSTHGFHPTSQVVPPGLAGLGPLLHDVLLDWSWCLSTKAPIQCVHVVRHLILT
jgi:hypothetical protein